MTTNLLSVIEQDDSKPTSRRDLSRVLTEWNDVTGALPVGGSWLCEVQGMLEDAWDAALAAGKQALEHTQVEFEMVAEVTDIDGDHVLAWNIEDPDEYPVGTMVYVCKSTHPQATEPAPIGCDYCTSPLYAGTKCKSCGRVSEPAPIMDVYMARACEVVGKAVSESLDLNITRLYDLLSREFGSHQWPDSAFLEPCSQEGAGDQSAQDYASPQEAPSTAGELQRYEPEIWREDRIRMEPDSAGDWVKFDDVAALLQSTGGAVGELTDEQFDLVGQLVSLASLSNQALATNIADRLDALLAAASLQPVREPLTMKQINDMMHQEPLLNYKFMLNGGQGPCCKEGVEVVRAVERAHGITKKGAPGAAKEQTP